MTVWANLVGQAAVVEELQRAVASAAASLDGVRSSGMTHAWLFTGPPGSGRSNAAKAFAAALQCVNGGCGSCAACHTALAGSHGDVRLVRTEQLSIKVEEVRALVADAARHPSGGRWQVILVEDADRLTEHAENALLKAIEEPSPRTVWLLCAPSPEDVLATIRSRCRHVGLRTPPPAAVADVLHRRDSIDPAMAAFAARASQGHIGRARRLATDEQARLRRNSALGMPASLQGIGESLAAAAQLVDGAAAEAAAAAGELDERESAELAAALGVGTKGRSTPGWATAQLKELEKQQKARLKRLQRDALDRSLVDLASYYRDVLAVQVGAPVELVNAEARPGIEAFARASTPEQTLRRIEAVLACRDAIDANAAPLLSVEALTIALR